VAVLALDEAASRNDARLSPSFVSAPEVLELFFRGGHLRAQGGALAAVKAFSPAR
jgi:hypothetical protein